MHSVALPQGRWDLAIIANVLRLEQPAAARSLLERVVAAIRPGGALLVIDALAAGSPDAERARAIYSLHLAMRTRAGRVHTPRDIARWMEEAGCETPTPLAFDEEFTDAGALGALVASRRPQQPRPAGARQ